MNIQYYKQDYWGNNRAVINGASGAIEQTVDYYPYWEVVMEWLTGKGPRQRDFRDGDFFSEQLRQHEH